jgi:hypothetical protein
LTEMSALDGCRDAIQLVSGGLRTVVPKGTGGSQLLRVRGVAERRLFSNEKTR